MSDPVFKVAKKGYNAETETDPNNFVFHSDYNTFKIIKTGTKTVTLSASTSNQTFSEAHGQRFIPLPHAFAKENGVDRVFLPNGGDVSFYSAIAGLSYSGIKFNYVSADDTNLNFNFDNDNASQKTVKIRYYVLEKVN